MNRAPLLLMILVTLLAAAGWLFSKEAIRELPTAAFIGSRFLLAALLLLPLAWLREPPPVAHNCCVPPGAAPCSGPACCSGLPPSARAMRSAAAPSS
jgi:drug/metabolite transporter (DMT)-like permease